MKGFTERFDAEVRQEADMDAKNADVGVHANLNRRNAAWIGGSMLASMSTFSTITLSYSEYQEKGEAE
jgi:actin-related protein